MQALGVEVLDTGYESFPLQEEAPEFVRSLLIVGYLAKGGVFGETIFQPLPPTMLWPSYHFMSGGYSAGFQFFFRGNFSIHSSRFGVSMEEVSLGFS